MKKSSVLISAFLFTAILGIPTAGSAPTIEYTDRKPSLAIIQDNSIQAISPVYFPNPKTYGMIMNYDMNVEDLKELIRNEKPLLYRIIHCESNWRNVCNTQGCDRGMGLAQIIPQTWDYVGTKISLGDDPMNKVDNLRAALWLFNNEGTQHWGYPSGDPRGYFNGERWGTWDCWAN